ncbi:MAG TPA: hypothetical protein VGP24_05925, partial [Glaciihabitans sp.]|jgi:hypothetical protein|nr:hypothetical protein [Glaciihabitans sp.]
VPDGAEWVKALDGELIGAYDAGWVVGVEGDPYYNDEIDVKPVRADNWIEWNRTYLVGYIAGMYARANEWETPTVRRESGSEGLSL